MPVPSSPWINHSWHVPLYVNARGLTTALIPARALGFEIELDISGLPPAPAGSYYQGWLRNEDGDAVTIGTFHGREGTDDIILWSGVDIADYSALTVTIQQEGAGAESSGRVVLRGETPAG